MMREERLELSQGNLLEPKSSASTNSATRAHTAAEAAAPSSRLAGARVVVENSGSVDAELLAHAGDVPGGLDVVLREFDLALGIDDDGRADDSLDDLAVVLLLAEGAPLGHHRLVLIGEQVEVQTLLLDEMLELLRLVRRDADDGDPGGLECGKRVPEIAGLGRASRGHCGRVEVHDNPLTSEIAEADGLPVLVGEGEIRGGVAD